MMKFLKNDAVKIGLIVVVGCLLIYVMTNYRQNDQEQQAVEKFTQKEEQVVPSRGPTNNEDYEPVPVQQQQQAQQGQQRANNAEQNLRGNQQAADCFPKDQLTPGELLPNDKNSKWAQVSPEADGELGDQNFLNAGYHVGINTVGQTLRNANLQLRSEPPNPQEKVSPWQQSTIEPDSNRKPLEIGGCN